MEQTELVMGSYGPVIVRRVEETPKAEGEELTVAWVKCRRWRGRRYPMMSDEGGMMRGEWVQTRVRRSDGVSTVVLDGHEFRLDEILWRRLMA